MAARAGRAAGSRARRRRAPTRHSSFGRWLVAILVVAAVATAAIEWPQVSRFLRLLGDVPLLYVLAALGLQAVTYVCAGEIWRLALARGGARVRLGELIPLALAMLFSNQAIPSAGVSGGLIVMRALVHRGVTRRLAVAALLVGLLTTYVAFVAAIAVSLAILGVDGALSAWTLGVAAIFVVVTGAIAAAILDVGHLRRRIPKRARTMRGLGPAVRTLRAVPASVLRAPRLLLSATLVQAIEIVFDAATYQVAVAAMGHTASIPRLFACYVIASATSRIGVVPLGLGTFEATSVLMLHGAGIPVRPALAATLLYRGFELWLPMAPGVWFARRAVTPRYTP